MEKEMKKSYNIWDYYKYNLTAPLSFISDIGDNLDEDFSRDDESEFEPTSE